MLYLGAIMAAHVLLLLFTHWSVRVRTTVLCVRAEDVHSAELVKVQILLDCAATRVA